MRTPSLIGAVLALLLLTFTPSAQADRYATSSSCSKPYKPYKFTREYEVDAFNRDVEQYKSCIEEFVEEQTRAVKAHKQAAEQAIDEWNTYVETELN